MDEGAQHALLLQPLLAQQAAARHKQDVEIPLGRAASVFPTTVTGGAQQTVTGLHRSPAQTAGWGAAFRGNRNAARGYYQLPFLALYFRIFFAQPHVFTDIGLKQGQSDLVSLQFSKGSLKVWLFPAN